MQMVGKFQGDENGWPDLKKDAEIEQIGSFVDETKTVRLDYYSAKANSIPDYIFFVIDMVMIEDGFRQGRHSTNTRLRADEVFAKLVAGT